MDLGYVRCFYFCVLIYWELMPVFNVCVVVLSFAMFWHWEEDVGNLFACLLNVSLGIFFA